MTTDFHHVYSKGEMVIFRDADDYIYFQNRLAIDKFGKNLKILAYSIMSTHVHMIVETWDEDTLKGFISGVKRAYSVHFKRKYGISLPREFFCIEYSDDSDMYENKKARMVYVLKNPVHHQVCGSPLSYEFSSARFTFWQELWGESVCRHYVASLKKCSELGARDFRRIIGRNQINESNTLLDYDSGAISPLSIIDISKAKAYWGKFVRNYLLDLHLNPKDSSGNYIGEDSLSVQTDKLSDMEVCKIIDDFAQEHGSGSFAFLKEGEINRLVEILRRKLVQKAQIERCLWVNL